MRNYVLAAEKRRGQIQPEGGIPFGFWNLFGPPLFTPFLGLVEGRHTPPAGAVDEDINAFESRDSRFDHLADIFAAGKIKEDWEGLMSRLGEVVGERIHTV